jgi:hypothetical protein
MAIPPRGDVEAKEQDANGDGDISCLLPAASFPLPAKKRSLRDPATRDGAACLEVGTHCLE